MFRHIVYIGSKSNRHEYKITDDDFVCEISIKNETNTFVSCLYDGMAAIIQIYSERNLPVVSNLHRLLIFHYQTRNYDKTIIQKFEEYFPSMSLDKYRSCLLYKESRDEWINRSRPNK